jgi:hypothetical protein
MRDLLILLLTAGFFALCVVYVWCCDRIIGRDPIDLAEYGDGADPAPAFVSQTAPVAGDVGDTNRDGDEVLA